MKQRLLFSLLALAAVALLWAPMPTAVDMSFSGPVRADRSFGVLPYLHMVTEYEPSRIGYAIQDEKGIVHRSEPPAGPLAIGQFPRLTAETRDQSFIWEKSEGHVIFIRPKDEAVTLKPVALGVAIALTVLILGGLAWQWSRARRVETA
jgi:hypothetical protein